jgi:ankyrin repeat protein
MSQDAAVAVGAVNATADRFLDALIIAFQSEDGRTGYAEDLRLAAGICSATWGEEQLWSGLVNVQCGERMRTRLMYAARAGNVARVLWLLARGAQTELKDERGWTALVWAAFSGHDEVVQALVAAGADVHARAGATSITPVYASCWRGHVDVLRTLIAAGANIGSTTSKNEATPIYIGSQEGHTEIVRTLIEAGADVNAALADGRRPLSSISAVRRFKSEIASLLVEAGAR